MTDVVPPHAAARVPVSKVSLASVPPNGSSKWVWASMPPGMTYLPVASITRSTDAVEVRSEQHESGLQHGGDRLAVDEHVGEAATGGRDHGAAGDEGGGHGALLRDHGSVIEV